MSGKKPNLVVYGKTIATAGRVGNEAQYKRIGVGWTNQSVKGVKYIKVQLDFMPNNGELTIWPDDERPPNEGEA